MANKNKIVLYKLQAFGNGFTAPPDIENGGVIWTHSNDVGEIIFVGEIKKFKVDEKNKLPEGIIEVITATKKKKHFANLENEKLKLHKRKQFAKHADPLFIKALREKLLGDATAWKEYLKTVEKI